MKIDFDGGYSVKEGFTVMWWDSRNPFNDVPPGVANDVMIFTHKESIKSPVSHVPRLLYEIDAGNWNNEQENLLMCAVGKYVDYH